MKLAQIDNSGKITGILTLQNYIDIPDHILVPDEARVFDYLIDGVLYPASEYANKIPTVKSGKVTWNDDMETLRAAKLREIATAFDDSFLNGSFLSTTLGIEVDCRRSGTKNDEQNVRGIISRMTRAGVNQIVYKGKTEEVPATLEQVQQLQYEMEDYAAFVYAKKWAAEAKVEAATTVDELNAIII